MALSLAETYYLKALSAYPFDMEEVCESLNYALSYDEEHGPSHVLLAKVYAKFLGNFEFARKHFELAMLYDVENVSVYDAFAKFLINVGDYEKAERVVDMAMRIEFADLSVFYHRKALISEGRREFKKALKLLKLAGLESLLECRIDFFKGEEKRIKGKMKRTLKKKKKAKA